MYLPPSTFLKIAVMLSGDRTTWSTWWTKTSKVLSFITTHVLLSWLNIAAIHSKSVLHLSSHFWRVLKFVERGFIITLSGTSGTMEASGTLTMLSLSPLMENIQLCLICTIHLLNTFPLFYIPFPITYLSTLLHPFPHHLRILHILLHNFFRHKYPGIKSVCCKNYTS